MRKRSTCSLEKWKKVFTVSSQRGVPWYCRVNGIQMKDLEAELEKLLTRREDCTLIARLATDKNKRETFARIARQLRGMAVELQADIAARSQMVTPDWLDFWAPDLSRPGAAVAGELLSRRTRDDCCRHDTTGKTPADSRNACQALSAKIFLFPKFVNHDITPPVPRLPKRRFAVVTKRGAGCDGRGRVARRAAGARTVKPCGPVPSTLGSSEWR